MELLDGSLGNDIARFRALTQATFRLSNLLTAERDRMVADLGLTSARWQVLETVGAQSAPVSAAHVGRLLQISRQAVQRVLNDLAAMGLVQLAADASDRRAQLASVTVAGSDLLVALEQRTAILETKFRQVHHADLHAFVELSSSASSAILPDPKTHDGEPSQKPPSDEATPWPARPQDDPAASPARTFENVQNYILNLLLAGDLTSGDRLPPERELASSLGVGRSAVREALRSLEMSGVLSFKRGVGGGAFVRESGSEGIEASMRSMLILGRLPLSALLELRASLLGQCARLGTERATRQDFARLDKNIDALETCIRTYNTQVPAIKPATEFYRLAARASHNPLMVLLVDAIANLVAEMLTKLDHQPLMESVTARRAMVSAMREGRADDAANVIHQHSIDTNRLLLKWKANFVQTP